MVIPLAIGFLSCILFLFRILQVQSIVEEALVYTGRRIAVESSVVTSEEVLFFSAEALFITTLKESEIIDNYVENGVWGFKLWRSQFSGEDILLHAEYSVHLPVKFFEIESITLSSQNSFRKWIGNVHIEGDSVYMTSTGTVYHTSLDCPSLDLSIKKTTTAEIAVCRGKDGQKYYPCTTCVKKKQGCVYYTDYGTLYHETLDCSSLKRRVKKVSRSEIGGRRQCTFCLALQQE